jgi:hypothetical protein
MGILKTSNSTSNSEIYIVIQTGSTDFHDYVDAPHEAVQVQAYSCSSFYVLLLAGDSSGNIIRGMNQHPIRAISQLLQNRFYLFAAILHTTYVSKHALKGRFLKLITYRSAEGQEASRMLPGTVMAEHHAHTVQDRTPPRTS